MNAPDHSRTSLQQPPESPFIHVVGLYKCGTSWLLHMLSAHPQVAGWREFDVIRAAYAPDRRLSALPLSAVDYLVRQPDSRAWQARREAARPRTAHESVGELFLGRGLLPVMGEEKQRRAQALSTASIEPFLNQLLDVTGFRLRRSDGPLIDPARHSNTLGVMNFRRNDLLALIAAVRDSGSADEVAPLVFDSLAGQVQPGARIACKAADQLMQLDQLRRASPASRVIAIIRDGRDAAISARHFEALMRKRQAPWATARSSYFRRLLGWAVRAAKLAGHARRGEVLVLRYEDLQRDFDRTCSALLTELGLDAGADIVETIRRTTEFSAVSGGRVPGEAAEDVVRKGSVGEWRHSLPGLTASLAWRLAGSELRSFGYGRDGTLSASPLVLTPR